MIKNSIIGIAFITGISALLISFTNVDRNKQVFIDMGKVYAEFELSKELNAQLEEVLKARKLITDSLYKEVKERTNFLKQKPKQTLEEMSKIAQLEENLYAKQQLFEKENQAVSANYSEKIWSRLNQYVSDYGAANKCTFILGANGQGNIMYADKTLDITDEVIKYVNNRYNDKIKK